MIILLGVVIIVWWRGMNAVPIVSIPPAAKLPSPNAFDYFTAACEALVDWNDDRDAACGYASSKIPSTSLKTYSLAQKEALVIKNSAALELFRDGLNYKYAVPSIRSEKRPYPKFNKLKALLILEGQLQQERGNHKEAIDSLMDIIKLSEIIIRNGERLDLAFGHRMRSDPYQDWQWNAVNKLNMQQVKDTITRLEKIMSDHTSYSEILESDKWITAFRLLEDFKKYSLLGIWSKKWDWSPERKEKPEYKEEQLQLLRCSKRQVMADYLNYMDRAITDTRLPYPSMPARPPLPRDPINEDELRIVYSSRFYESKMQVLNGMLLTGLALRAYYIEHGSYPASLSNLTPNYLKKLPDDPFAAKGPFCYHRKGNSYILYSIGPDGKDDGGQKIPRQFPDEKGDILSCNS